MIDGNKTPSPLFQPVPEGATETPAAAAAVSQNPVTPHLADQGVPGSLKPQKPLSGYKVTLPEGERGLLRLPVDTDIFSQLPELPDLSAFPENRANSFLSKFKELKEHFNKGEYVKGMEVLERVKPLAEKVIPSEAVAQFLNTMELLFSLNRADMRKFITRLLPGMTEEEFIKWHLELAHCSAVGTSVVPKSRELELQCLRRAADAGSQQARFELISQLLLNVKSTVPSLYLPEEAMSYIKAMAEETPTGALKTTTATEKIIGKLVALAADPTPKARDDLAEQLGAGDTPEKRVLSAALYLEPLFGEPSPDQTLKKSRKHEKLFGKNPELRYWQVKAQLRSGDESLVAKAKSVMEEALHKYYG